MPSIYLIANNMNPSENLIKYVSELKINNDDLIVVFNKTNSPLIKLLPRIDIVCFRFNGSSNKSHYHGINDDLIIRPPYSMAKKFFFMHGTNLNYLDAVLDANNIRDRHEAHREGKSVKVENIEYVYGGGKAPTTGMFYVFYFLNNYPNLDLKMIGFDAFAGKKKDSLHPYSKEKNIIDQLEKLDRVKVIV